ncbi:MAG: hypothetical protein WC758_01955 [Candidatus Woesearchaeota archaeon]|jgi:hypothetical protein
MKNSTKIYLLATVMLGAIDYGLINKQNSESQKLLEPKYVLTQAENAYMNRSNKNIVNIVSPMVNESGEYLTKTQAKENLAKKVDEAYNIINRIDSKLPNFTKDQKQTLDNKIQLREKQEDVARNYSLFVTVSLLATYVCGIGGLVGLLTPKSKKE